MVILSVGKAQAY